MKEFLNNIVNKLKSNDYDNINIVIGNESCDLDSAVCSIVYALYLNWQHNQIKCKVCTKDKHGASSKDDIFIPILNMVRQDFALKTEVMYLFNKLGITEGDLIFRNDYDLCSLLRDSKCNVVLVDHHVLAANDVFLSAFVTEIIDHRPLDKSRWTYKGDTRLTIEIVGSCATLVTRRIKELCLLLGKELQFFKDHMPCSQMLYSTIILDTVNFSKEFNKGTPEDEEMIDMLERVLMIENPIDERQRVLDELTKAKSDVSKLTAAQLLRKDVKIVEDVLIPSFPILVEEFLRLDDSVEAVREVLIQRECSVALLLGMDLTSGMKRDMAVMSPNNENLAEKLDSFLVEWSSPSFELRPRDGAVRGQLRLSATRKQYVPVVQEFLRTL